MASTTVKRTGVTLRNSAAGDEHGKAIPAQILQCPTRHRPSAAPRSPLCVLKQRPNDSLPQSRRGNTAACRLIEAV